MSELAKHQGQSSKPENSKPRTPAEIQADIDSSRENLTQTLGELQYAVKEATKPANIAKKAAAKIRGIYVSPQGEVNIKNVGITAGVVIGLVALRKFKNRNK